MPRQLAEIKNYYKNKNILFQLKFTLFKKHNFYI